MFVSEPVTVPSGEALDESLTRVPPASGVFAVWPAVGQPYLGRAGDLRRRLTRLLRAREGQSRLLNLRNLAERVEYWPTASRLESWLVLYELAKTHLPDTYLKFLKLRMPVYLKLTLANQFPRTLVTSRMGGGSLDYGPFRSRASAEQFEREVLDLFQLRRCQEDLAPAPDHPGCIYGEMGMCLRPCQQAVSTDEYASEAARVAEFLRTDGRLALHSAEASRDRLSADMDFEEAARQHKRIEKIEELLRNRDDLARDASRLSGAAVVPSPAESTALLWFMVNGVWQAPVAFSWTGEKSVSMDSRLREIISSLQPVDVPSRERSEHLALLARWFYSSWRDGAWIQCESLDRISYRRLVPAVSKAVHQAAAAASE